MLNLSAFNRFTALFFKFIQHNSNYFLPPLAISILLFLYPDQRLFADGYDNCIHWETLLKQEDQDRLVDLLNNKRPYPEHREVVSNPEQCRMVHTTYLGRHASRHVTEEYKISRFKHNLMTLLGKTDDSPSPLTEQGELLHQAIIELSQYVSNCQLVGSITELGVSELQSIARRLLVGTQIFNSDTSEPVTVFTATSGALRTNQSLNAFIQGLEIYGMSEKMHILPDRPQVEATRLLRSYAHCPKRFTTYAMKKPQLKKECADHGEACGLSFKFIEAFTTAPMDKKQRIDASYILYKLCQIESNFLKIKKFGFCSLLSDESEYPLPETKILRDFYNHKQWYKRGFASGELAMIYNAAPILEALVDSLNYDDTIPPAEQPSLRLWFTHESATAAMVMLLGYMGDQPSVNDWQSHIIAPMSANLQFRVYWCESEYIVQVLFNEQPVCLPGCPNAQCSLTHFKNFYKQKLSGIDLQSVCDVSEESYDENE